MRLPFFNKIFMLDAPAKILNSSEDRLNSLLKILRFLPFIENEDDDPSLELSAIVIERISKLVKYNDRLFNVLKISKPILSLNIFKASLLSRLKICNSSISKFG